jgi:hypothetical protein
MSGIVYNTMKVHYDDDGKVYSIHNDDEPGYKQFEIEVFLIEKFLTGQKRISNYDIEYFFNLSKGLEVEDEDEEISKKSENLLYIIPISDISNTEITLEHNVQESKWIVSSRTGIKDKLDIMPVVHFFVCKHFDPHYLYTYFSVNPEELKKGPVEVPFQVEEEKDLANISVATQLKFKSYRIKEIG